MEFQFKDELDHVLLEYGITREEICLVGSVVLSINGLREHRDVDIVISPKARERITLGSVAVLISQNVEVVGRNWPQAIGLTDDDIINDNRYQSLIGGFKIVRLEILFAVMLQTRSEKNLKDLRLIECHAIDCKSWDWALLRRFAFSNDSPPTKSERNCISLMKRTTLRTTRFAKRAVRDPVGASAALYQRLFKNPPGISETWVAKPESFLQAQVITKMPTAALFGNQFLNGEFARYDVLLRYLAVKSIDEGNEEFKPFYVRMQKERVGLDTYSDLINLVCSIRQKGFLSRYPIPITEEGLLVDGAHRLACALYFQVEEVPVTIRHSREKIDYGRQWFVERGFAEKLLICLDRTRNELFERHGVWFPVLLWATVSPWFDEISEKICSLYKVKWKKELSLNACFPEFVRAVYAIDDIDRWKVELKIWHMEKYEKRVFMLILEIPDPKFRQKERPISYLSQAGETLKQWIRETYKSQVSDYFYDVICHVGDNHEHNRRIMDIVRAIEAKDLLTYPE